MRVYIMTDMEGISGIFHSAYVDENDAYYRSGRELLTADVNAAIAGCFDAGADEVVVKDGHSRGTNFVNQKIDPRVQLDVRLWPWTGILDERFDASLFVGTHAMAGTLNAFLDHTMCPETWHEYSINGKPLGEIGMWATMCGHFNVPLVYTCGDAAACAEARKLIPGITATAVKQGVGRNAAHGLHPDAAHAAIRRDVAKALTGRRVKPLTWKRPLNVRLIWNRSDYAEASLAGLTRVDARTVEKQVDNQFDIII